jgi:hypothetical protein
MRNKSFFHICLMVGAAAILPHLSTAQVMSPLLKAVVHNGHLALQVNSPAAVDSLFARDTSNQVTLDFYFTPNDTRNGFYAAQPSLQLQGDALLSFQGISWATNDALTFSVSQYGPDGDIVRGYTFVNGDYTGPDGSPPSICPTSIACSNFSGLTMTFPPQYLVQKVRTLSLSLSFGPDNPYNGIYQTNGVDVATNAVYVKGNFNCSQISTGSALLMFDGLVCQYAGGQLLSPPPCTPFGNYYTPGDVCAEYFENCASKLMSVLFEKSTELPCRQWKEKSSSTCGTGTYIYRPGKVSIGTTKQAPNSSSGGKASLSVKNGVITDKVKVKMCDYWCDYVFDPGYTLRSLPQTEAYIRENGHLPGMPSGGEIEAEGAFELGEITRLQQEKIEEMYLHLIALQKEVEVLEIELTLLEWRERSVTK